MCVRVCVCVCVCVTFNVCVCVCVTFNVCVCVLLLCLLFAATGFDSLQVEGTTTCFGGHEKDRGVCVSVCVCVRLCMCVCVLLPQDICSLICLVPARMCPYVC